MLSSIIKLAKLFDTQTTVHVGAKSDAEVLPHRPGTSACESKCCAAVSRSHPAAKRIDAAYHARFRSSNDYMEVSMRTS